jgi:hypothetical protein
VNGTPLGENGMSNDALEVYLREFDKLAAEQTTRIGFRDNLLYVTLASYGAVIAFAITQNKYSLYVLPLVSAVLGWAYLSNNAKVSQIGAYIRDTLEPKAREVLQIPKGPVFFLWEWEHRKGTHRRRRKWEQFFVDEITFVASGLAAFGAALALVPGTQWWECILIVVEPAMLVLLGYEIWVFADVGGEAASQTADSQTAPSERTAV